MRFKTMHRKQNLASAFGVQKENLGNHAFFRDKKASIWRKTPYIALYFIAFQNNLLLLIIKKCVATQIFFMDFNSPC